MFDRAWTNANDNVSIVRAWLSSFVKGEEGRQQSLSYRTYRTTYRYLPTYSSLQIYNQPTCYRKRSKSPSFLPASPSWINRVPRVLARHDTTEESNSSRTTSITNNFRIGHRHTIPATPVRFQEYFLYSRQGASYAVHRHSSHARIQLQEQ